MGGAHILEGVDRGVIDHVLGLVVVNLGTAVRLRMAQVGHRQKPHRRAAANRRGRDKTELLAESPALYVSTAAQ